MDVDPSQLRQAADQVEAVVAASGADGLTLDLSGDVGDDNLAAAMTSKGTSTLRVIAPLTGDCADDASNSPGAREPLSGCRRGMVE